MSARLGAMPAETEQTTRASGVFPLFVDDDVANKLVFWDYWSLRGNPVAKAVLSLRNSTGELLDTRLFPGAWTGPTELAIENIFPRIRDDLGNGHTGSVEVEFFYERKPRFTYPAISLVYSSKEVSSLVHTSMRFLNSGEKVEDPFLYSPQTGFDVFLDSKFENYLVVFLGHSGTLDVGVSLSGNQHEVEKIVTIRGERFSSHVVDLDAFPVSELEKVGPRPKVQVRASQKGVFPRYFCMTRRKSSIVPSLTHSFFDINAAVSDNPDLGRLAKCPPADNTMFSSAFLVPLLNPSLYETSIETYDCIAPFFGKVTLNLCSPDGQILESKEFETSPGRFFQRRESINLGNVFDLNKAQAHCQVEMVMRSDGTIPVRQKVALNVKKKGTDMGTNICFSPHTAPETSQANATRHHWFPIGGSDAFIGTVHSTLFSDSDQGPRQFGLTVATVDNQKISVQRELPPRGFILLSPETEPEIFEKLGENLGYVYVESKGMPFDSFFFSIKKSGVGGDHSF